MVRSPIACSGDMYCGVPNDSPVCVSRSPPACCTQSNPEVGDERLAILQEDVLRLDVPVNHAMPVRVIERTRDFTRDADSVGHRQLALPLAGREAIRRSRRA